MSILEALLGVTLVVWVLNDVFARRSRRRATIGDPGPCPAFLDAAADQAGAETTEPGIGMFLAKRRSRKEVH